MEEKSKYYWNDPGSTFDGKKLGTDITGYFVNDKGEFTGKERLKKLIEKGTISEKKPVSIEIAKESELNQLRKTVEEKNIKIADLEDELMAIPRSITKARNEIKKLKADLIKKNEK